MEEENGTLNSHDGASLGHLDGLGFCLLLGHAGDAGHYEGGWKLASRGCSYCQIVAFCEWGGVSLTWLCWAGSAAGWPLSLTHGSRQAPHVPFQCSSVLLDWVSSWFCRARVCQSLPLHSRVVTLSPSCCAPLSSPFYPAWTGQSISGHLVGSRPRTPVLTLPSLALRALQTATCLLPVTPLRPHGRTCSSLTCLLAHVLTPSA